MCYYYIIIAKLPFTKPSFVNTRVSGAARGTPPPLRRCVSSLPAEDVKTCYAIRQVILNRCLKVGMGGVLVAFFYLPTWTPCGAIWCLWGVQQPEPLLVFTSTSRPWSPLVSRHHIIIMIIIVIICMSITVVSVMMMMMVTIIITNPLLTVSVDSKGFAAVVVAKWGVQNKLHRIVWKRGWYGWIPSSNSNLAVRVLQAYPLIETRQTAPCRAIRGSSI